MTRRHPLSLRARMISSAVVMALAMAPSSAGAADWLSGGQDIQNSRSQASETAISSANAGALTKKWSYVTAGDVSATPAVDGALVFFPDSAGSLYAVARSTGALVWKADIAAITGIAGDYARATPAISGSTLVIGTQSGKFETAATPAALRGAYLLGLNKATGALKWKTKVDDHFTTIITQSAQVYKTTAYIGTASNEEAYANKLFSGGTPYVCCSFRGSVSAVDVATGAVKWKRYMTPADPGYSGAAIWGSTPAIDQARNAVYVTTGNNYSLPASRTACVDAAADDAAKRACLAGDLLDSIVALDLTTGAVKWSYAALASDAWNTDCGLPGFSDGGTNDPTNCPANAGPDYDFGQGPMLFKAKIGGVQTDVIGAGQKSGQFHLLNRATGASIWTTQVGPGGLTGGLQWGSSTDGKRIYVAESNSTNIAQGWWSALDPSTGAVLWTTPDPGPPLFGPFGFGYSAQGPVSSANGVVYGCSLNQSGPMLAMDAATGAVRWRYDSGSSCLGGAAIADGTVYWGTGYRAFAPLTTPGNSLTAFSIGGA
jgi:polyvinyl alcohol dehydrogenase (cytochrome)